MKLRSILKKIVCHLPLLALCGGSLAMCQVAPAAASGSGLNAFVSFGGLRTHVIDFTYNALGVEGGLYIQPKPYFGLEARAATYPMYARYTQMPVTTGYRAEVRVRREFLVSGYAGGGMSVAQDGGHHYVPTEAQWDPCFQLSQSTSINMMGRLRWNVYSVTFTQTYTPIRTLQGVSVTTGVVYTLSRSRR